MPAVLRNHNVATGNVDDHNQKEAQYRYATECGKENQRFCPTDSNNNGSISCNTKKKNGNGKFKHKKKKQQQAQHQNQHVGRADAGQPPSMHHQPIPGSSHMRNHNPNDGFHPSVDTHRQPRMRNKQKHIHQSHSSHFNRKQPHHHRYNYSQQPHSHHNSSLNILPKSEGEFSFDLQDIPRVQYPFSNVRYPVTMDMSLELDLRKIYRETDAMLTDQACRQLSRM